MGLTFEDSGDSCAPITLNQVAELALECGFEKKGAQTPGKAPAQRADLDGFFGTYGFKAFSPFKQKFMSEKVLPPDEHLVEVKKVSRPIVNSCLSPNSANAFVLVKPHSAIPFAGSRLTRNTAPPAPPARPLTRRRWTSTRPRPTTWRR